MTRKLFISIIFFLIGFSIFLGYCHLGQYDIPKDVIEYEENPIQLAISSPGHNQTLTNKFSVKGIVTSINPITELKIFIDEVEYEVKVGAQWEGPYDISTDTITLLDPKDFILGSHNITVSAKDSKGYTKSSSIHFIIANELKLAILSHSEYQIIPISQTITVTGSCNGFFKPFDKIEVWVDELPRVIGTINTDLTWSANLPPLSLSTGQHIIYAKLYDSYSVEPNTVTAQVIVKAIDSLISVRLTTPDNASAISGVVNLKGYAYASKTPFQLDIQLDDNNWVPIAPKQSWDYQWDTSKISLGYHVVTIRITDAEGREAFDYKLYKVESLIVKFVTPLEGSSVRRACFVAGSFSSSHLVKSVQLQLDRTNILSLDIDPTSSAFWSTLDSTSANNVLHLPQTCLRGYHTFGAIATDIMGNVARDEIVVDVKVCENIAWITGVNDDIQNLLYSLGYTAYMTSVSYNILTNSSTLNQYCWLVKNCDGGMSSDFSSGSASSSVVTNLRGFIANDHSFFSNDNELNYVSNAYPEYMTFVTTGGYSSYTGTMSVLEPSLQQYLGNVNYITGNIGDYGFGNVNFNPLYPTTVWIRAPITYSGYTNVAMMTTFRPRGTVCYTAFHLTSAGTDIRQVLKFIIDSVM